MTIFARLLEILTNSKFTPFGVLLERTESAFARFREYNFEASIFKKSAIKYPVFGVFLLTRNLKSLINRHFQILKG